MELSSTFLLIAPSWARNMETTFVVKNVLLFFSFFIIIISPLFECKSIFFFLSFFFCGFSGGSGWWCKMVGAGEGSNTERKKKRNTGNSRQTHNYLLM